ncbi:metal-dependent transcriptional regulator [Lacticaseibacillus sharpeae]|uniref:Manganese transport regulator n=1 Tax=Lacticaseibacillus sharpeae JCM 1186 = DSM 20505 TaxID=1291052 RepID=A0A0R1ZRL2_9LACO|nr:metal-dependent transcriptional regulator [Lacticaseibacillus sharpeae]KRM54297.1 Mn-dependent transcriptional regulator [Lacticaseibacillus sharpeae JCM 1186 = DSM 20505]
MTPNKEDYLKIILELGGDTRKVSNKQIVASLNVSAASVSEMVTKLVKQEYVTHTLYQGIQLTEKGIISAAKLVRNHRLWEVFLMKQLMYPYDALHKEAEALEHATTDDLANRLDYLLKHPEFCPHGGVIPDTNGHYTKQSTVTLASLAVGDKATVERVIDETALLDYLSVLDVKIGDALFVVAATPKQLTLRNSRTKQVLTMQADNATNVFVNSIKHVGTII